MNRRQPSEPTRRKNIHYARKSVGLMKAGPLALAAIDPAMVRVMVETMAGSDGERHLVFRGLDRFLAWCVKQGLVEHNVCDELDRHERPRGGQSRDHVPSLEKLRAIWAAVENEPQRDLAQFFLLVPLRRAEAASLRWSEVDLQLRRIRIPASRMKNREAHELPLSAPALEILKTRKAIAKGELVFRTPTANHTTGFTICSAASEPVSARARPSRRRDLSSTIFADRSLALLAERGFDVDLLDQCSPISGAACLAFTSGRAGWPNAAGRSKPGRTWSPARAKAKMKMWSPFELKQRLYGCVVRAKNVIQKDLHIKKVSSRSGGCDCRRGRNPPFRPANPPHRPP